MAFYSDSFKLFKRYIPAVALLLVLCAFSGSFTATPVSVELGVAEESTLGAAGGVVVPASCESDPRVAHYPGDLDPCTSDYDFCPNIVGLQLALPAGHTIDGNGNCVVGGEIEEDTDVCLNLAGNQNAVPLGYRLDTDGTTCVLITCEEGGSCDMCPNIVGIQTVIPAGLTLSVAGDCVPEAGESCYISATPERIDVGQFSRLTWGCSHSTYADGVNFSTGGAARNTSPGVDVSPSQTTVYTLQCEAGCIANKRLIVNNPLLRLSADPIRVRKGNASTLTWSAEEVTNCTLRAPGGAALASCSGSGCFAEKETSTGAISAQSVFTLSCSSLQGGKSASVTVGITPGTDEI